jgi:hypothetical protein
MTTDDRLAAAVRAFPELAMLHGHGRWMWVHEGDGQGGVRTVTGTRTWADGETGQADSIRIESETDAKAVRMAPDGLIWERAGTAAEVCLALAELPPPGHPLAPKLVIRTKGPEDLRAL